MTRLNFSDQEKKKRTTEFVEGKIDRLLSIAAFKEKGMAIPETSSNKNTTSASFGISMGTGSFPITCGAMAVRNWNSEKTWKRKSSTVTCFRLAGAQGRNQPRESRGVLRKTNLFKTEEKDPAERNCLFSNRGEPQSVLLQQARKVVEEFKKGFLSKSLLLKTAKAVQG